MECSLGRQGQRVMLGKVISLGDLCFLLLQGV